MIQNQKIIIEYELTKVALESTEKDLYELQSRFGKYFYSYITLIYHHYLLIHRYLLYVSDELYYKYYNEYQQYQQTYASYYQQYANKGKQ